MKRFNFVRLCALLGCSATLAAAQAAQPMPKEEMSAQKARIETDYKTARDSCKSLSGNAKDVCVEEAKGAQKVARAELDYRQTVTATNQQRVAKARTDAAYDVAKEKCDDLAGNPKDVCIKEAKAAHEKALADIKVSREVGEARTEAVDRKRDAEYDVAVERCDSFGGDAKTSCIAAAKLRFGKS
jgi:hypothetical protein